MQKVMNQIKERIQSTNTNNPTNYFFFTGGQKDLHIPIDSSLTHTNLPFLTHHFNSFFHPQNTLLINTNTDLKNVYSSLNHASFFYSKFFMDTFSVFLGKVILEKGGVGVDVGKR